MRRLITVVVAALAAGCDYSSTAPGPYGGPAVEDGLWTVSGSPGGIVQLAPCQLADIGTRLPTTLLTTPSAGLATVAGVAFAADGTMWITSAEDNLLLGFSPAALATSGSKPATRVIAAAGQSLVQPTGLAFDAMHRLWVANHDGGTVVRFDPSQLEGGGNPVPAVVISGVGRPTALAFDAAGALWLADDGGHRLAGYSATQLTESGAPVPAFTVAESANSLASPTGLAFDGSGRLWVTNITRNTLVAFDQAQLAAGGAPAPIITLRSMVGSLMLPAGLAFDREGNLWVVGAQGTLTEFAKADLAASGAPALAARVSVRGHAILWNAAFWPVPAGLPIQN